MNRFKKRLGLAIASSVASSLLALAPVVHAATNTFDGSNFLVSYGVSNGSPATDFFTMSSTNTMGSATGVEISNLPTNMPGWQVDTMGDTLSFTWNKAAEFMNSGSPAFIGFKITDIGNQLTDILGASVTNTVYTPSTYGNLVEGFDQAHVTFDANNIYVNLNNSMWHAAPMASMGDPFRDHIALSVNFQSAPPIPEPETYAMLLAGLGLMGAIIRRRQRSSDSHGK